VETIPHAWEYNKRILSRFEPRSTEKQANTPAQANFLSEKWVRVAAPLQALAAGQSWHADALIVPVNPPEASLPETSEAMKAVGRPAGNFAGRRVFRCARTSTGGVFTMLLEGPSHPCVITAVESIPLNAELLQVDLNF
jgi:hypothetical protein